MKKIRVKTAFNWAREGVHVESFAPGEHEVPDRCAEVALEEGWAEPADAPPKKTSRKTSRKKATKAASGGGAPAAGDGDGATPAEA